MCLDKMKIKKVSVRHSARLGMQDAVIENLENLRDWPIGSSVQVYDFQDAEEFARWNDSLSVIYEEGFNYSPNRESLTLEVTAL